MEVIDIQNSLHELKGTLSREPNSKRTFPVISKAESRNAKKEFESMFNSFIYRFSNSEVFSDFLDYSLLVMKWWEDSRDFSYFENKYKELYPKFLKMYELLSIAADNGGEGFCDALGDLFMDLVSHGRNGQYFTPDSVADMMARIIAGKPKEGDNVLDPTCGSGRLLLSYAKEVKNAMYFGCDNDITCCKMAVLNMVMNTMDGEIAFMDSLRMDFRKSWRVWYTNINGINIPVYKVIEKEEDSLLWKMHLNSFQSKNAAPPEEVRADPVTPIREPTIPRVITTTRRKSLNKQVDDAQLELF